MMYTLVFIALVLILAIPIGSVSAGGPRLDTPDPEPTPESSDCWVDGYEDGQNNPFNDNGNRECQFDAGSSYANKPYYNAFLVGCADVEGNTREDCERNID